MKSILILLPEIFLSIVALKLLVWDTIFHEQSKIFIRVSVVSLAATAVYLASFFVFKGLPGLAAWGISPEIVEGLWIQYPLLFDMITVDSLAVFFKISIVLSVLVVLWLSADYREFSDVPMGTYTGLMILAAVGMMLWVSSVDFLMAVIAIELLSVTSFVLTGFVLNRRSSAEAAIKYFLVGSFSTAILLFGISYYYGMFGTTSLLPLLAFGSSGVAVDKMLILIMILLLAGLGFKLAMVPFHMWAPDAYEGAPTPVAAFLSVAPKAAAVGFLVRLLSNHDILGITGLLSALAVVTMTVGNVGALQQTNLKRLLAYSSIAQVGYILVALVAGASLGIQAAMIYTFVYIFMNLGVFAVVTLLSNARQSDDITIFSGLAKTHFGLSVLCVVFLLSMAGIPPLAGFIGKFAVFSAVISTPSLLWLGVVAVLNSVVSLFYYFRIAHQMFFVESNEAPALSLSPALVSGLALCGGATVAIGIFPHQFLNWVKLIFGV